MRRQEWGAKTGLACMATCCLLWSTTAAAQDVAMAAALFDKGLAAMEAGDYKVGCPAIAESLRLDPRPGTLFTLAECEAGAGKIATAVARYQDYLEEFARMEPAKQKKQLGREKLAEEKKRALTPLLPMLTVNLPEKAPVGVSVQRDGAQLAAPALNVPLPVDPGEHVIKATYPNGGVSEKTVVLKPGEKVTIDLEAEVPAPQVKPVTTSTAAAAPASPPHIATAVSEAAAPGTSKRRIAAFALGGVGAVGLVLGAVTGGLVLAQKGVIDQNCVDVDCNADGKAAADSAKSLAPVSTVGFAAGAALLAGGALLFFTEPRAERPAKQGASLQPAFAASDRGVHLSLSGRW